MTKNEPSIETLKEIIKETPKEPLKILMLEDSPDDVHLIERILRKGKLSFASLNVDTRDGFVDALRQFKPDIVLSDHALPGFNSHEALRLCKEVLQATPFILVTGTASDEFATTCMREGADDYIPKHNVARLPAAIREALKKRKAEKQKQEELLALKRKNRELATVNRALDNFTYTISHHLNGPITTAMGLLNLARQTYTINELHAMHGLMHNSLNRLDEILKALLECSRNAHREVRKELIHWDKLINASFERVEHLDPQHSVTRIIHLQDDAPVYSDPQRLTFVLGTVLNNALTYSNHARGDETIVGVEVISSAESTSITVRDNGKGIKAEALPKVCELFYRGTEDGKGTGLGLYIVKEIMATLNGTIDISSTEGAGTTVLLEFPNMPHPQENDSPNV